MKKILSTIALLSMGATTMGCSMEIGEDLGYAKWNRANNPAFVDADFEYNVSKLPIEGAAAQDPIPADYWPTYKDSLNQRWNGADSQSPTEKFAAAFSIDGLEDIVSRNYGIDKYKGNRKSCTTTSDCSELEDGSSCAKRRGAADDEEGVCIPTWWGMCHGWAPYAISEPAAVTPIEHNGVTFYPGDIEALMSLVYGKGLRVKFLSERCNEKAPEVGEDGRIPEDECRDMNPGSLHIVATNMLGLRQTGFVEDRTYDLEVWNQPVKGFRITNANSDGTLKEVTKEEAVALLELPEGSDYTYNLEARRFFHVSLALDWITEAPPAETSHVGKAAYTRTDTYEYILETDADGNIFGGEYIGASKQSHPDFVWWPTAKPNGWIAEGKITYQNVKLLNDLAAKPATGGGNDGGNEPGANTCGHSECSEGDVLEASCSPCATAVCAADDYCCSTEWDSYCVEEAKKHEVCGCN